MLAVYILHKVSLGDREFPNTVQNLFREAILVTSPAMLKPFSLVHHPHSSCTVNAASSTCSWDSEPGCTAHFPMLEESACDLLVPDRTIRAKRCVLPPQSFGAQNCKASKKAFTSSPKIWHSAACLWQIT